MFKDIVKIIKVSKPIKHYFQDNSEVIVNEQMSPVQE
jgi:hypothetical protein